MIYALGFTLIGMLFAAVGTLCAQLVEERRTASGIAAAVLGLALLLRMVADGVERLAWLSWLTPFGLLAEAEPYAANRLGPLAVMVVMVSAVAGLALLAAAHRDVGSGLITGSGIRPGRFRLLRSVPGFAIRRCCRRLSVGQPASCAYFLIIGLLARSLTEFLIANPRFADLAAQAGFAGLATVQGYAAALFAPAGHTVGGLRGQPAQSRCRRRGGRAAGCRVRSAVATFSLGPRPDGGDRHDHRRAGDGCRGGHYHRHRISGRQPAADRGACGCAERRASSRAVSRRCSGCNRLGAAGRSSAGAAPAVGGFLLTVLVDAFNGPNWLAQLSPFAHLAWVPATAPNWAGAAGMIAVSVLLASLGIAGFARRDLRR